MQDKIRNFCIIAHIDHGKSTLADRFLEITETVDKRNLKTQFLDSMELEREKGITIKLKAVRMAYKGYQLNLIDTPGHVDFSYEVSRSLAACEGAILVVDVSQGIQAQTVSNIYKALEADLTIIPVINKIDLKGSDINKVTKDITNMFGFSIDEIIKVSAKTGEGIDRLLDTLIEKIPAPKGNPDTNMRALIFDSYYDEYMGVIAAVKVVDGRISSDREIRFLATNKTTKCDEIGYFSPKRKKSQRLSTGEVGYIATGLKDIHAVKVGDTVGYETQNPKPLPGYKNIKPFVFVSIFPVENDKYNQLRNALDKLSLSDASLTYEPETGTALGFGFRCGFLGLLHADIIQERLEREYSLNLVSTTPTVEYQIIKTDGEVVNIRTASEFLDPTKIRQVKEPWIKLTLVSPTEYTGNIISLCEERRGIQKNMEYPSENTVLFEYELPLSELVYNFFDDLKSVSSGFASLDYNFLDFRPVEAVKLDILVHGEIIEPLSYIVLKNKAEENGRKLLKKLKEVIPRQQFKVALQAAIGGKIVAREDIPATRKDVLAGIYGGHRERKDKLLERQKKGKARLKKFGKVDIPQEAFRQILKK
ncbi:elongation factor 4 [Patescibacteria group bacterium]|nr:elongation factor 4 [Patescibacteria group bacterium]